VVNSHYENVNSGCPQTNPDSRRETTAGFAYENEGNGRLVLTVVRAETQEPFPPGSLKKYITPERDAEMLELLKGCSLEIPDEKAV
jgi:hypothetical protein